MSAVGWDAGPVVPAGWFDRDGLVLLSGKLCSGNGARLLRVQARGAGGSRGMDRQGRAGAAGQEAEFG